MLVPSQIDEIREHLEKAQNPLFFYDNDPDGLCSYLLLRRFIGRGKGVAVRSHPAVDAGYARKAQELQADYIFVLDRPYLGESFVEEISKLQLPIVHIDHHSVDEEKHSYKDIWYYNAGTEEATAYPVTYWSYKVANRVEDMWIAMMGCVFDHHLPDFKKTFAEHYPDYWGTNVKEPFDAYYGTEIGRLARSLSFGLKDSITHVVQLQNFLLKCVSPGDLAAALESQTPFGKKYRDILRKYDTLVTKAQESVGEKLLFFVYGGDMSISSDIANELSYRNSGKTIAVAYKIGGISNISLRGDNILGIITELLPDFEHATGGGHRDAVGMRLRAEDLERFKEALEKKL